MSNFQHILKQISESLSKVSYDNGDLSDVGNEVGIAIGNYITTEQDFKDFVHDDFYLIDYQSHPTIKAPLSN